MTTDLKVHVGCGNTYLNGWFNCDVQPPSRGGKIDQLCDARQIPLPDESASVVMACHVIEHFARYEAPHVLAEWRRILKKGGLLILELPNLEDACRNLLAGKADNMSLWPIYGDWNHEDPHMLHKHGYTPGSIQSLLEECGFTNIKRVAPQTHGRKLDRDMRIEAIKK